MTASSPPAGWCLDAIWDVSGLGLVEVVTKSDGS